MNTLTFSFFSVESTSSAIHNNLIIQSTIASFHGIHISDKIAFLQSKEESAFVCTQFNFLYDKLEYTAC